MDSSSTATTLITILFIAGNTFRMRAVAHVLDCSAALLHARPHGHRDESAEPSHAQSRRKLFERPLRLVRVAKRAQLQHLQL